MLDILKPLAELEKKWRKALALIPNSPSGITVIATLGPCADELATATAQVEAQNGCSYM